MTYKRRPPIGPPSPRGAGPAGNIGGRRSTRDIIAAWYASHDRPVPQLTSKDASNFFGTSGGPRDYSPGHKRRSKSNVGRRYHS